MWGHSKNVAASLDKHDLIFDSGRGLLLRALLHFRERIYSIVHDTYHHHHTTRRSRTMQSC